MCFFIRTFCDIVGIHRSTYLSILFCLCVCVDGKGERLAGVDQGRPPSAEYTGIHHTSKGKINMKYILSTFGSITT